MKSGVLDEESPEDLNSVTELASIIHNLSEIVEELSPEALKRVRERNWCGNLPTLSLLTLSQQHIWKSVIGVSRHVWALIFCKVGFIVCPSRLIN